MKPLPTPSVPGDTLWERFDNAVGKLLSVPKEAFLKEEPVEARTQREASEGEIADAMRENFPIVLVLVFQAMTLGCGPSQKKATATDDYSRCLAIGITPAKDSVAITNKDVRVWTDVRVKINEATNSAGDDTGFEGAIPTLAPLKRSYSEKSCEVMAFGLTLTNTRFLMSRCGPTKANTPAWATFQVKWIACLIAL